MVDPRGFRMAIEPILVFLMLVTASNINATYALSNVPHASVM
jgi:hypothetical protein